MTKIELEDIWRGLRALEPADHAGDYRLRLCASPMGTRVFAAVGGTEKDLSIVVDVPVAFSPTRLAGVQLRRVAVQVSELNGLPPSRIALVLRLLDPAFEELFADLAEDVLGAASTAASTSAVVAAVCAVVTRWRRFMDGHAAPLSNEGVRGLIGELAVLERLTGQLGPADALASWKSPQSAIRDFETPSASLEVKTFSPSAGATVRINDPLQLEPDPARPLFLACHELGLTSADGNTLADHVRRVSRAFAGDVRIAGDFRDALAGSGFLDCHSAHYQEGYALGRLAVFQVAEAFPRIPPAAAPPGVSAVRFSLTVSALAPFAVNPDVVIGPVPTAPGSQA